MNTKEALHRSTMRGLRKCSRCSYFNGIRARGCNNGKCPLYIAKKRRRKKQPSLEDFDSFSECILNSVIENNPENKFEEPTTVNSNPSLTPNRSDNVISMPLFLEEPCNQYTELLEVADCQIELMDQFKLTDQIDLCSNDIQLCEEDLFQNNNLIFNMLDYSEDVSVMSPCSENIDMKDSKTIEKRKKLYVDSTEEMFGTSCLSLDFSEWLTFVIEDLNSSFKIDSSITDIKRSFTIKNDFFNHLRQRFSQGKKKRSPSQSTLIKNEELQSLHKTSYTFTTFSSIQRIFSTEEITLQTEKKFLEKSPGVFEPFQHETPTNNGTNNNSKLKKLLPDVWIAYINLQDVNLGKRRGFTVSWIPNILPKSKFGEMSIEFSLGYKKHKQILIADE